MFGEGRTMEQQDDGVFYGGPEASGQPAKATAAPPLASWGFGLGCLLAGGALAYHLLVYIPARDARLTPTPTPAETSLQADLAAAEKIRNEQIERQRVQAEEAHRQDMRRVAYQNCLSNAEAAYSRRWNGQCRLVSERNASSREDCIRRSPGISDYCTSSYPQTPPTGCSLPSATAEEFSRSLELDKTRCLNEMNAGLL